MGCCQVSKTCPEKNTYTLTKKITIKPSQFVVESQSNFSHFYKIGEKLGGGIFTSNKKVPMVKFLYATIRKPEARVQ